MSPLTASHQYCMPARSWKHYQNRTTPTRCQHFLSHEYMTTTAMNPDIKICYVKKHRRLLNRPLRKSNWTPRLSPRLQARITSFLLPTLFTLLEWALHTWWNLLPHMCPNQRSAAWKGVTWTPDLTNPILTSDRGTNHCCLITLSIVLFRLMELPRIISHSKI
jgi:hypothetical protein